MPDHYFVSERYYDMPDEIPTSIDDSAHVIPIFQTVVTVLSAIGALFNLLVIVSIAGNNLKTNIKLIVSLAVSDMLVDAFHFSILFIEDGFQTPWSFMLSTTSELVLNPPPPFPEGGFPPPPQNGDTNLTDTLQGNTSMTGNATGGATNLTEAIYNATTTPAGPSQEFLDFLAEMMEPTYSLSIVQTTTLETPLQKFFSAFYFTPIIAGVWTMMGLTICVLTVVTFPLKQHLILGKHRGTIAVAGIWIGSILFSTGLFIYTMIEENNVWATKRLINTQSIIWAVDIGMFGTMALMYVVIVCFIVRRRGPKKETQADRRRNIKATVTVIIIVATYALCYLTFIWPPITFNLFPHSYISHKWYWYGAMQTLFIVNTVVDPLIYAVRIPEVADGMRKLTRKIRK